MADAPDDAEKKMMMPSANSPGLDQLLDLSIVDNQQVLRSLLHDKLNVDSFAAILPQVIPRAEKYLDFLREAAEEVSAVDARMTSRERAWKVLIAEAKSFDKDKDGIITRSEINDLVREPSVVGARAMAVASLKLFERSKSGDEEKTGVKIVDLERLNNLQVLLKKGNYDRGAISGLLTKYKEGKVEDKELEQLTSFGKYLMEGLGGKKDDPKALTKFDRDIPSIIADLQNVNELELRFDRITRRAKAIDGFGAKLYGTSKNHREAIKPEAVCQGLVGNCYYMAGIASLAELKPEDISKMLKQNKDGTFTVTFPDKKPIIVKPPTACELMLYAGVTEHGIWPAVLDKAFGKYCKDNPEFRKNKDRGDIDQECSEGGGTTEGICILTGREGHPLVDIDIKDRDKVWSAMADSLKNRLPVIAGSGFGAETLFNGGKNSGLESRHAYAILKIEDDRITLRNPYGKLAAVGKDERSETGKITGTFQLTKEQFWKYFTEVELLK